jgi:hypothetical protein
MENKITKKTFNHINSDGLKSVWTLQQREQDNYIDSKLIAVTDIVMAKVQEKLGLSDITIDHHELILNAVNKTYGTTLTLNDFDRRKIAHQKIEVVADTTTKPENPITLSVLKWLKDAKRCNESRAKNYEILTKANFVTKDNVNAVIQAFERHYQPVVDLPL